MGISIWQDRSFSAALEADVVVVGAGFSGAAVAWWLARVGLGVTVVDQAIPGAGASGQGLGRIEPLPPEPDPETRRGRESLEALIKEREHLVELTRDADGALRLHPVALVTLLLDDVRELGGAVVSHQRVFRLQSSATGVEVLAAGCTLAAEEAVVCVGAGLRELEPDIAGELTLEQRLFWAADPAGPVLRGAPPVSAGPSHAWRRARLVGPDGHPVLRRASDRVRVLAGVREERWDRGFEAARAMAAWISDGWAPGAR